MESVNLILKDTTVEYEYEGEQDQKGPVKVMADQACFLIFNEEMTYGETGQRGKEIRLEANTDVKIYPRDNKKTKFAVKRSSTGQILTPTIAPTIPF